MRRTLPLSGYVALGVSLAVALAMCSVPLLGIQGTESALVLGVVQTPLCAYACCALARRLRAGGIGALHRLFTRTLGFALVLWLVPVLVLALDSLRIRNCSPLEGWLAMVLGQGLGLALASLTGIALALLPWNSRWLPLLAAAIPVATMLRAISTFYFGPGIFAYGHYFGFSGGTLYDENVALTGSFWWMRVATLLWLLALSLLIVSCTDPERLELSWRPRATLRTAYGIALLCTALGLAGEYYTDDLGWSSSSARTRAALGGELISQRCHLYLPREWQKRDRLRLGEDCDFRVHQAEAWLGLTHPAPVDVYLYRSPAEKYQLIGAEGTNIAKPWRSEVHISELGWPNPVLGHEVVHVVARGAGSGLLRISGALGGLWPNPALIEGVAVAAAWQVSSGLTPHEWAHAMLELNMVPPLKNLFGPSFLGQQHRLAYTLSGSLLRFVRDRWGARAVRATYTTGSLERGVGVPVAEIDAAWREAVRAQPLSANALALARARFSGAGILSALCPHTLAKLRDTLRADLGAGDEAAAETTCDRILNFDPNDLSTRASLAALLARKGDDAGAREQLARLVAVNAPLPYLTAVRHALADQALREGRYQVALDTYEALAAEPNDDDQRRLLQVKALTCRAALSGEGPDAARQAKLLFELLAAPPPDRADGATAVFLTRELRALRSDGLPHYLEARQLFFQARFVHAAELIRQARERGLPSPELNTEAIRVEAISRLALREFEPAKELFEAYGQTGSAARGSDARDYLARIRFMNRSMEAKARAARE